MNNYVLGNPSNIRSFLVWKSGVYRHTHFIALLLKLSEMMDVKCLACRKHSVSVIVVVIIIEINFSSSDFLLVLH